MNDETIQDINYGDDQTSKYFEKNSVINKVFDDSDSLKINKKINIETDPSFMGDLPKTIISNDKTFKTVGKGKMINKSFDNVDISKKDSKDIKMEKDFNYDGKINKNIKVDDTFNMKANIVPKYIINSDKSSKIIENNKVINKSFEDDGSKKITISDIDVNNKVNPAVEINLGQDKVNVKITNKENDVQKTFDIVDKVSDASSLNLLKLSETKESIKTGGASDVHKKIVIDDHDLSDKNTDISIAKDEGTNVEIHRIWDGPILELTAVDDNKRPAVYEYLLKPRAGDGSYDDYEVYE